MHLRLLQCYKSYLEHCKYHRENKGIGRAYQALAKAYERYKIAVYGCDINKLMFATTIHYNNTYMYLYNYMHMYQNTVHKALRAAPLLACLLAACLLSLCSTARVILKVLSSAWSSLSA